MNKHDLKTGDMIRIKYNDIDRIAKVISCYPILKIKEYVYWGSNETIYRENIEYYVNRWIYNKNYNDKRMYILNGYFVKASDKDISNAKNSMFEYFNAYMEKYYNDIRKINKKRAKNKKDIRTGLLSMFLSDDKHGALSL